MICTFFGHKDTPSDIEKPLHDAIIDLIKQDKRKKQNFSKTTLKCPKYKHF